MKNLGIMCYVNKIDIDINDLEMIHNKLLCKGGFVKRLYLFLLWFDLKTPNNVKASRCLGIWEMETGMLTFDSIQIYLLKAEDISVSVAITSKLLPKASVTPAR